MKEGVSSVSTPNLAVNPTPLHVNNVNPSTPLLFNSVNPPTLEKVSVANFITPGFAASNRVFAIPSIKAQKISKSTENLNKHLHRVHNARIVKFQVPPRTHAVRARSLAGTKKASASTPNLHTKAQLSGLNSFNAASTVFLAPKHIKLSDQPLPSVPTLPKPRVVLRSARSLTNLRVRPKSEYGGSSRDFASQGLLTRPKSELFLLSAANKSVRFNEADCEGGIPPIAECGEAPLTNAAPILIKEERKRGSSFRRALPPQVVNLRHKFKIGGFRSTPNLHHISTDTLNFPELDEADLEVKEVEERYNEKLELAVMDIDIGDLDIQVEEFMSTDVYTVRNNGNNHGNSNHGNINHGNGHHGITLETRNNGNYSGNNSVSRSRSNTNELGEEGITRYKSEGSLYRLGKRLNTQTKDGARRLRSSFTPKKTSADFDIDLTDGSAETDTCLTMSMREILDRSWENEGNHGSHGNNGNHGSHAAINALLKSNGITSNGSSKSWSPFLRGKKYPVPASFTLAWQILHCNSQMCALRLCHADQTSQSYISWKEGTITYYDGAKHHKVEAEIPASPGIIWNIILEGTVLQLECGFITCAEWRCDSKVTEVQPIMFNGQYKLHSNAPGVVGMSNVHSHSDYSDNVFDKTPDAGSYTSLKEITRIEPWFKEHGTRVRESVDDTKPLCVQQLSAKTQYSTPSPDERDKLLKMSHDLVSLIAQLRKDKTELDNTCQEKIRVLDSLTDKVVKLLSILEEEHENYKSEVKEVQSVLYQQRGEEDLPGADRIIILEERLKESEEQRRVEWYKLIDNISLIKEELEVTPKMKERVSKIEGNVELLSFNIEMLRLEQDQRGLDMDSEMSNLSGVALDDGVKEAVELIDRELESLDHTEVTEQSLAVISDSDDMAGLVRRLERQEEEMKRMKHREEKYRHITQQKLDGYSRMMKGMMSLLNNPSSERDHEI